MLTHEQLALLPPELREAYEAAQAPKPWKQSEVIEFGLACRDLPGWLPTGIEQLAEALARVKELERDNARLSTNMETSIEIQQDQNTKLYEANQRGEAAEAECERLRGNKYNGQTQ